MEKYFCSYTQSLSLKELGFEKECLASISVDMGTYIPSKGGRCELPTHGRADGMGFRSQHSE